MSKKLICKNDIVDAVKKCEPIQLKMFYGLLYKFKENVNFKSCDITDDMEMSLQEIKAITGKGHFTEQYIKSMIDNMPTEIKFINGNYYGKMSVFDFIIYDFEYECINFSLSETFAEILIEMLDKYTIIEFEELSNISSKYSQRLYELSKRYLKQQRYLMKIDDFKRYFNIPDSYKMGNIDQKILNPAIKELNSKTNINCSIEKKKKGRNVTHILFEFKKEV